MHIHTHIIHPTEAFSAHSPIASTTITTIRSKTKNEGNRSNRSRLYTTRADADTETERDTINIRRKSYGAPVVDSTLLRFISQQKKVPEVFREAAVVIEKTQESKPLEETEPSVVLEPSESNNKNNNNNNSYASEATNDDHNSYDSTTNVIKQKLTGVSKLEETTATATATATEADSSSSWMAQFGSKNVAQLLMANDEIDEALAKTAGDAVERYCVVRTARQRIRRFLKERDTLWASNGKKEESLSRIGPEASLLLYAQKEGSLDDESGLDDNKNYDSTPSYNFEDVLAVMKNYGLKGNDICVLLTHSPNLALRVPSKSFLGKGQIQAETLEETLERSLRGLLMKTLGLRRYDARKILRTCPGLLCVRGSKSAVQVVTIVAKTGVSHKSLARDKNALPVLLSRSPSGLFRLVAFLSSTAVRMPLEQIGPLLRKRVGRELMDALLPVPNTSYSKSNTIANANINANANANINASANANVVNATTCDEKETSLEDDAAAWSRTRFERQERIERTYASMTQTARVLKAQIGTQDLSKVVAAYPQVLLLDAEKQILPVARYLMGGLGIWQNDLSGVLQLYPTLLGTKIDDLERVVSYVLTLGVDEDDLAGIFRAFPGLFALEVKDMEAVVSYLESIGVRDIGAFVTKLPSFLGYSVEKDLKPKWEFLKTVCLQPEFELKEFPAYFSYPFDRVIKTRFNYLAYKGISIRFVSMRIDTVLRFGDVDFATKVALDDDKGEAFRTFANQRGSSSANGAAAQKLKKKRSNNRNRNKNQNKVRRLSENIDNAKDLAELNRVFREPASLRNKSLGNSLPDLKPSRPKGKQKMKNPNQNQQQNQNQQERKQQAKNNNRNPKQGGAGEA